MDVFVKTMLDKCASSMLKTVKEKGPKLVKTVEELLKALLVCYDPYLATSIVAVRWCHAVAAARSLFSRIT